MTTVESTTKLLSHAQRQMMYRYASKLGMSKEDMYALIARMTHKAHTSEMTSLEGKRVIDAMMAMAGETPSAAVPRGRATKAQIYKIHQLEQQLGWAADPKRLKAWLEGRYHASHISWLTDREATKCIEALKAMHKGSRAERRPPHGGLDAGDHRQPDA